MPKVTKVEKSRHSPGNCGRCGCEIEAGQPYKWWKFRRSGKLIRCAKPQCAPKSSDLTQSEFWKTIYGMQEEHFASGTDPESLTSERDDLVSELESFADEQDDKRSNLPYQLQDGETGTLLEERAQACRDVAQNLQNVDVHDDLSPEECEEAIDELSSALQDFSCS